MCRGAPVPLHANFCAIGIRRELWKPAQLLESVNESIVLLNEPDHLLPQTIIKKKIENFHKKSIACLVMNVNAKPILSRHKKEIKSFQIRFLLYL